MKSSKFSLVALIKVKLKAGGESYTKVDRETLTLLGNDPDTDRIWREIERVCGRVRARIAAPIVITEIVGARRMALSLNGPRNFREEAGKVQSLVAFLKGLDPYELVELTSKNPDMFVTLDQIALFLREKSKGPIRPSRKDMKGSRRHTYFMQLLSDTMRQWCGHYLDGEVADLTNIFFPTSHATINSVRSARRSQTRRKRRGSEGRAV